LLPCQQSIRLLTAGREIHIHVFCTTLACLERN
jgi:hypothetical protein